MNSLDSATSKDKNIVSVSLSSSSSDGDPSSHKPSSKKVVIGKSLLSGTSVNGIHDAKLGIFTKYNDNMLAGCRPQEKLSVEKRKSLFKSKKAPSQFIAPNPNRGLLQQLDDPTPKSKANQTAARRSIFKMRSVETLAVPEAPTNKAAEPSANDISSMSIDFKGPDLNNSGLKLLAVEQEPVVKKRKPGRKKSSKRRVNAQGKRKEGSTNLAAAQLQQLQLDEEREASEEDLSENQSSHDFESDEEEDFQKYDSRATTEQASCWERTQSLFNRLQIKIPTSSFSYQVWKVLIIVLSFVSSFQYAYYAAFFSKMDPSQVSEVQIFDLAYSILFAIDMLTHIFVDEQADQKRPQTNNFKQRMILDLFAIIPLRQVLMKAFGPRKDEYKLFYLSKVVRLYHGFQFLDYKQFTRQLKQMQLAKIQQAGSLITKQSTLQGSTTEMKANRLKGSGTLNISRLFLIQQMLKTLQLIVILICISYFGGLFWYIHSDICLKEQTEDLGGETPDTFITTFGLEAQELLSLGLTLTYFTFTTLSTVGLGDYHPRSDRERVLGAFILLFGVLITSVVMENFNSMLTRLKELDDNYQEYEALYLFIGTIQKFNEDQPIAALPTQAFVAYFQNRWMYDKNLAIASSGDPHMFHKMPKEIERKVYEEFMFKDVRQRYQNQLEVPYSIPLKRKYVKTKIQLHNDGGDPGDNIHLHPTNKVFILAILRSLEPLVYNDEETVFNAGQDVEEIVLPQNFDVKVGFNYKQVILKLKTQITKQLTTQGNARDSIQVDEGLVLDHIGGFFKKMLTDHMSGKHCLQQVHFPLVLRPGIMLGLFEVLFRQKTGLIYRVVPHREMDRARLSPTNKAYFIRLKRWRQMELQLASLSEWTAIMQKFKDQALLQFFEKIYYPVKEYQDQQETLHNEKEEQKKQRIQKNIISLIGGGQLLSKSISMKKMPELCSGKSCMMATEATLVDVAQRMSENSLECAYDLRKIILLVQQKRIIRKTKQTPKDSDHLKTALAKLQAATAAFEAMLSRYDTLKEEKEELAERVQRQDDEMNELMSKLRVTEELLDQEKENNKRLGYRIDLLEQDLKKTKKVSHEAFTQTYFERFHQIKLSSSSLTNSAQQYSKDDLKFFRSPNVCQMPLGIEAGLAKASIISDDASDCKKNQKGMHPSFEKSASRINLEGIQENSGEKSSDEGVSSLSIESSIFDQKLKRQNLILSPEIPRFHGGLYIGSDQTGGQSCSFKSKDDSESDLEVEGIQTKKSGLTLKQTEDFFSPPIARPRRNKLSQKLELNRKKVSQGLSQFSDHKTVRSKKISGGNLRMKYSAKQMRSNVIFGQVSNAGCSESIIEEISVNESGNSDGIRPPLVDPSLVVQSTIREEINVSNLDLGSEAIDDDILLQAERSNNKSLQIGLEFPRKPVSRLTGGSLVQSIIEDISIHDDDDH